MMPPTDNSCVRCLQPIYPSTPYTTLQEQMVAEGHTQECASSMKASVDAMLAENGHLPLYATRKQRRVARRARQASFAAWAAREQVGTTSLRKFTRPRGWLGKNWRWTP